MKGRERDEGVPMRVMTKYEGDDARAQASVPVPGGGDHGGLHARGRQWHDEGQDRVQQELTN